MSISQDCINIIIGLNITHTNTDSNEKHSIRLVKVKTIVEHPFGTMKRQWGFSYIVTKQGINRAGADVGLMFIAYNLRRLINILDQDMLRSI